MQNITFMTLNVRGLNNCVKCKHVYSTLLKSRTDILTLKETHCKNTEHGIFPQSWFNQQFLVAGLSKSSGVAILLPKKFSFTVQSIQKDF